MNKILNSHVHHSGTTVSLVQGDITEERVEAIVNAANSRLIHGGGVAGAISRKGGPTIQEESYKVAPVEVGGAALTTAGKLPAKYVIHAVGPRWGEGDEEAKLASAVGSSLRLASERKLVSISLPAISTGIFGFPLDRAVEVILGEIRRILEAGKASSLKEIRLCLFDDKTVRAFQTKWQKWFEFD